MSKLFNSFKDLVPSFFKKADEVQNVKTSNFLSELEIKEMLKSKFNIEIINALKYLILNNYQKFKDCSGFIFNFIELINHKSFYIKRLVLCLLDYISFKEDEVFTLIYNCIDSRLIKDTTNLLNRQFYIQLIGILGEQKTIVRQLTQLLLKLNESNPILRKTVIQSLKNISYDKSNNTIKSDILDDEALEDLLVKSIKDSHPQVFSQIISSFCSINNCQYQKDYFVSKLPLYFDRILSDLTVLEFSQFENTITYITNFTSYALIPNKENHEHIKKFVICIKNILCVKLELNYKLVCLTALIFLLKRLNDNKEESKFWENFGINSDYLLEVFQEIRNCLRLSKLPTNNHKSTLLKNNEFYISNDNQTLINQLISYNLCEEFIIMLKNKENYKDIENINQILEEIECFETIRVLRITYDNEDIIINAKLNILIRIINNENFQAILKNITELMKLNLPVTKKQILINSLSVICSFKSKDKCKTSIIKLLIDLLKKDENLTEEIVPIIDRYLDSFSEYYDFIIANLLSIKYKSLKYCTKKSIIIVLSKLINIKPSLILNFYKEALINLKEEIELIENESKFQNSIINNILSETNIALEEVIVCLFEFGLKFYVFNCENQENKNYKSIIFLNDFLINLTKRFINLNKSIEIENKLVFFSSIISSNFSFKDLNILTNISQSNNKSDKNISSNLKNSHFINFMDNSKYFNSRYLNIRSIYYDNDNISLNENENLKNFVMEKYINHFKIVTNSTLDKNSNLFNINSHTTNKYENISNESYSGKVKENVKNFEKQFDINDDKLNEYKKKLELEMNKLLDPNYKSDEEQETEAEIIYD